MKTKFSLSCTCRVIVKKQSFKLTSTVVHFLHIREDKTISRITLFMSVSILHFPDFVLITNEGELQKLVDFSKCPAFSCS